MGFVESVRFIESQPRDAITVMTVYAGLEGLEPGDYAIAGDEFIRVGEAGKYGNPVWAMGESCS